MIPSVTPNGELSSRSVVPVTAQYEVALFDGEDVAEGSPYGCPGTSLAVNEARLDMLT